MLTGDAPLTALSVAVEAMIWGQKMSSWSGCRRTCVDEGTEKKIET